MTKDTFIKTLLFYFILTPIVVFSGESWAEAYPTDIPAYTIFDDRLLLEGYQKKYQDTSKEILLAMIKDETLNPYQVAAVVRVFTEKFSAEVVSKEKKRVEKLLLRRLNRTDSPFVQVEVMYALCKLDRYRYFKSMAPALIQKLNHYNQTVNALAFEHIDALISDSPDRPREARRVFNTLRKMLFLSRKRLEKVEKPDGRLAKKLKLLRWSIKILGTQEIQKLPKEVLNLL